MRVSVAVPLFNEALGVDELLRRIGAVLDSVEGGPHEIVAVDDGSMDTTLDRLQAAAEHEGRLVVVSLSRNFGHQAALSAALDFVSGDVTIILDGDLQDPPELIHTFLARHADGFDVVYAQRATRQEGLLLRGAYFLFYRVLQQLSDVQMPLDAGDCALLSRRVVDLLRQAPERQRFLRGLRSWVGFRQCGVPVDRHARHAGESKYTVRKLVRLAFDGLLAFSTAPIRAAAILGGMVVLLSTAFAAYAVVAKLFLGQSPQGFTALTVLIVFSAGVQLLFLGIIGEYVGRVYDEVKRRPVYVVSKVLRPASSERGRPEAEAGEIRTVPSTIGLS